MSDDSDNQDFGCKLCWPSSAEAAWEARSQLKCERRLIDESHYAVAIETCAACEQRFIVIFADTIDWAGGEDPMYWTVMPLTQEEVQELSRGEPPSEAALRLLGPDRRSLHNDWPKGADEARAFGVDSFQSPLAAAQMQVALKVAQGRMTRLLSKAKSDPKRLDSADRLLQEGDLNTACQIYLRMALSRPKRDATEAARRRLEEIQTEARQQRVLVDLELDEALGGNGSGVGKVADVFTQYQQLVSKYGCVPVAGDEIRRHVSRKRRSPKIAGILNEAESQRLWELGKQYEREQQLCCAYQVYEEAAKLVPSQTAQRAKERIAELERSPEIFTAVMECRNLQRCQEMFQLAETVAETDPKRASQRYQWIVEHSPKDSSVFQVASARLELDQR